MQVRDRTTQGDESKLAELMLYIAMRTKDDQYCGAVKLNKILYHSDFRAFLELGRPITAVEYVAESKGPIPRRLLPVRRKLIESGAAKLVSEPIGDYVQQRLVALREPQTSLFTVEELELVDRVIDELRHMSGTQLSEATHKSPGWRATAMGKTIPYETAFVRAPDSPEEYEYVRAIALANRNHAA